MAEFLDTTAISYHLERLLKTAKRRIVLISPYLKLRLRVRELIEDAAQLGVQVQIVYGKKEPLRRSGPPQNHKSGLRHLLQKRSRKMLPE